MGNDLVLCELHAGQARADDDVDDDAVVLNKDAHQ
jgi:hypothetical protein